MQLKKNNSLWDMEFKIPAAEDKPPPLEYHPLSPRQYLDFIEMGIKFNPNLKKAREYSMKNAPKVRFSL